MPFVRTGKGSMLNGEEVFKLWVELGSTNKVTKHYNRMGFKNPRTGRPITQMTVWMNAIKWVVENPDEARPYYQAAGAMFDDDEWETFLVSKAMGVYKTKGRFVKWAKSKGLFEKRFWQFASHFSFDENDLEYYSANPVELRRNTNT